MTVSLTNNNNNRSIHIDCLKGIAMIATILGHALQRGLGNERVTELLIWDVIQFWHMPLFFAVSGYLLGKSTKFGTNRYLFDKAKRLVWVSFIWRWIQWLLLDFEFTGLLPFLSYVPKSFTEHFLYILKNPFRPMWYTFDLFLFILIIHICKKISQDNQRIYKVCLGLTVVIALISFYYCRSNITFLRSDYKFLYYDIEMYGFALFGLITSMKKELSLRSELPIIASCGVVYLLLSFIDLPKKYSIVFVWAQGIFWIYIIVALVIIFVKFFENSFLCKQLTFVGKNSLQYYTLQFICLNCAFGVSNDALRCTLNFIFCMAICTLVIFITNKTLIIKPILWPGEK